MNWLLVIAAVTGPADPAVCERMSLAATQAIQAASGGASIKLKCSLYAGQTAIPIPESTPPLPPPYPPVSPPLIGR
jgi:hypothetical protein